ncbi:hypothetical protein QMP26_24245 [Enterocloster clostridioformis]
MNIFEPDILSAREDLLKEVLNNKVINMARYGLEPKEHFSKEYNIADEKKAFSLSEGALLIEFENDISLGFNSDEEICSVITWAEKYKGKYTPEPLEDDPELFPIKATDIHYSKDFYSNVINKKLIKYEIIKQEPYSATYYSLPREVGLLLTFSDNSQFIIAHQLTKEVSDNFTVLELSDIEKSILPTLYKTSQFWN